MKRILLVLAFTACAVAYGSDKHKSKTYDLTGTIKFKSFSHDSEAHVTVNGETHDSYCSLTGSSISCTDEAGAFVVTFANGDWTMLGHEMSLTDLGKSHCDFSLTMCDPLMEIEKPGVAESSFHYRTDTFKTIAGPSPFFCVGFTVQDKHGKDKDQERCYEIRFLNSHDGKPIHLGPKSSFDQQIKIK